MKTKTKVKTISELWAEVGKAYGELEANRRAVTEVRAQLEEAGLTDRADREGGFVPVRNYMRGEPR